MIRLLIAVTLLVCALVTPTLADPVIPVAEARFDFEDQDLGPIDLWGGLELTDALTGLRVTFDRVSNTFPVALPLGPPM